MIGKNQDYLSSSSTQLRANFSTKRKRVRQIFNNYELYLFLIPAFLYVFIFLYGPMYGVQIAFKKFIAVKGIIGSPWVGFKHFVSFFNSYFFGLVIKNSLTISLYYLIAAFPIPIIFALLLNQLPSVRYKKIIQTVTYAPHFISVVILVGMLNVFLSPRAGLVNVLIKNLGGEPIHFMAQPEWFRHLYVFSGIWQNAGFNAIIYLAALSGINPELHEAAIVDGASKIQRIWHIDLTGIMPTAIILLILSAGHIMSVGFEKIFLMQNALNVSVSEVISTYVYKRGLIDAQYSFSAAVGLFNSVINCIILILVNQIAKKVGETSLF